MSDEPTTDPTARIAVPVTSLVEAIRFIDAFTVVFRPDGPHDPDEYKQVLRELWPEIVDGVNERCNAVVSTADPAAFIRDACTWAIELSSELRDSLATAGVNVVDYTTVTQGLID